MTGTSFGGNNINQIALDYFEEWDIFQEDTDRKKLRQIISPTGDDNGAFALLKNNFDGSDGDLQLIIPGVTILKISW